MHRERREYNTVIINFQRAKMAYVDKSLNLPWAQHPTDTKNCFNVFKRFFRQL